MSENTEPGLVDAPLPEDAQPGPGEQSVTPPPSADQAPSTQLKVTGPAFTDAFQLGDGTVVHRWATDVEASEADGIIAAAEKAGVTVEKVEE
jgi:hypothetical protein